MFTECQAWQNSVGPNLAVCNVTVMCSGKRSGMKVLKKMGQQKFSGRLSKQAGCFGTYCILNRTVLDNLIYMIKRTDWRSCCCLERLRLGRLLVPKQNSCTRRLYRHHWLQELLWLHPSQGALGPPQQLLLLCPTQGGLSGFSWVWGCPEAEPNPLPQSRTHTWTLPSSQTSAHHYGVNASGGLKHSDT